MTASRTGRGGSEAPALLKCATCSQPGVWARAGPTSIVIGLVEDDAAVIPTDDLLSPVSPHPPPSGSRLHVRVEMPASVFVFRPGDAFPRRAWRALLLVAHARHVDCCNAVGRVRVPDRDLDVLRVAK